MLFLATLRYHRFFSFYKFKFKVFKFYGLILKLVLETMQCCKIIWLSIIEKIANKMTKIWVLFWKYLWNICCLKIPMKLHNDLCPIVVLVCTSSQKNIWLKISPSKKSIIAIELLLPFNTHVVFNLRTNKWYNLAVSFQEPSNICLDKWNM